MKILSKIALGGGCHWCTEAVFQSLKGVCTVDQGFVVPSQELDNFSEAVVVHYDPMVITMKELITIHLYTHKSTKNHSMRHKYRSALYLFTIADMANARSIITELQTEFSEKIITKVLSFGAFKASEEQFQNYYYKDIKKPFCETHIAPKLQILLKRFSKNLNKNIEID